jgi:signal transduction histidine kinase
VSTDDLNEVPVEVLRRWQGRWHYPVLADLLADQDIDPEMVVHTLLSGLAEPRTPRQTTADYIEAGMFERAEDLLSQVGLLPPTVAADLERRCQEAVTRAEADTQDRLLELRSRAEQCAVDLQLDDDELLAEATRDRGRANAILVMEELRIGQVERQLADELRRQADEVLGAFDGDGSAWHVTVSATVENHDFAAVRELIARGPGEVAVSRPQSVPRPQQIWSFDSFSLAEVLTWYEQDREAATGFGSWLPGPDDTAAIALVRAMRGLVTDVQDEGGIAPRHALEFTVALQEVLGNDSPECSVRKIGPGVLMSVHIPPPDSFPSAPLTGGAGLPLWIADPSVPPPTLAGPLLWFVPSVRVRELTPWRVARLDAADILRLLPPTAPADLIQYRRVNLLRAVAARLPAEHFLGQVRLAESPTEIEVRWLLDLAGIRADRACVQAILREIAGHTVLLRRLLLTLAADAAPVRSQQLAITALNALWREGKWPREALRLLLRPIRHDAHATALLFVIAAFFADKGVTCTLGQLIPYLGGAATAESVQIAADQLVSDRLLERAGPGQYRLPDNRLRDLLTQDGPDKTLDKANRSVEELKAIKQDVDPAVVDRVVRFVGHGVDGYLAGIKSELAVMGEVPEDERESRLSRADRYATKASGVYESYQKAVSGDTQCNLHDLLSACAGNVRWVTGLDINVAEPVGPDDVFVRGNEWLLRESFRTIFDNAVREIRSSGDRFGSISITITRETAGPPSRRRDDPVGDPLSPPRAWALVVIDDSGPGVDEETRAALEGGPRQGLTPHRQGTGLSMARGWFAGYGGFLEIAQEPGDLGGARIRVWLPSQTAGAVGDDRR